MFCQSRSTSLFVFDVYARIGFGEVNASLAWSLRSGKKDIGFGQRVGPKRQSITF